jgi:hypothetical protein
MGSRGQTVLSLIVLRVVIGSIRPIFVGFGYHAELEFLGVVLNISSFFLDLDDYGRKEIWDVPGSCIRAITSLWSVI